MTLLQTRMHTQLAAALLALASGLASAQDLPLDALSPDGSEIPPTPVELGVSPPPMLLLMLDDSLSMSSNLLMDDTDALAKLPMGGLDYAWTIPLPADAPISDGAYTNAHLHRLAAPRLEVVNYWNDGAIASRVGRPFFGGVDLHPDYDNAWKAYSPEFNSQYYDPTETYEPWPYGVDATGAAFADASPTAARLDPYDPTAGVINLTARLDIDVPVMDVNGNLRSAEHDLAAVCVFDTSNCDFRVYIPHYYVLTDTNADSVIDDNDTPTLIEITDAAELQNFANWFQYHRSRAHSLKASLSTFMAGVQDIYLGTAAVNRTNAAQVEVDFLNDDETTGHRRAVMDAIFSVRGTAAGTPLRQALDDAKNYFACDGSTTNLYGNTNCPRLPDATAGSCQQAATILATDGFDTANGATVVATVANGVPGSNVSVVNTPDANGAANADGDDNTSFDGGTYADSFSGTLGDVAMDAFERDLDATLDARQFASTYVLHLGLNGTVSTPTTSAGSFAWPNPTHGAGDFDPQHLLDDLTHAAFNGRGASCAVGDPDIIDKFGATLDLTAGRSQGTSGIGIQSGAILSDQLIYLASYNTDSAEGDLEAFELDMDGSLGDRSWSAAERLDVDLAGSNWEDRLILTFNQGTRSGIRFAPDALCEARTDQLTQLGFDSEINEALADVAAAANAANELYSAIENNPLLPGSVVTALADLRDEFLDPILALAGTSFTEIRSTTATTVCAADGIDAAFLVGLTRNLSEARVDYIRGDRSNEAQNGGDLRDRSSLMGPIYRSEPVFVGAPAFDYPDDLEGTGSAASYSNFRSTHASRREMVYVGGNDGMLHGFDANTGEELLAYVPGAVLHRVADIASPGYTASTFVDGEISVVDAYDSFPACPSGERCWRTVLVGGLGSGGQGYFALDVTEPGNFASATTTTQQNDLAEDIVLWEFTDSPSGLGIPGLAVSAKLLVQGILTDGLYDFLGDLADPVFLDDLSLQAVQDICKAVTGLGGLCELSAVGSVITLIGTISPDVAAALTDITNISVPLTGLPTLETVTTTVSEFLDDQIPTGLQYGHPDMGFSFARPNITRMADGRWAAVLANGYHATDVDIGVAQDTDAQLLGLGVSTSGNAVLYVVDLATGAINAPGEAGVFDTGVGNWVPPLTGTNASLIPIDAPDPTGTGTAGDFETNDGRPNGLADPAPVDLDGDFIIDRIYAGDERGNMWRIDTSDSDSDNWDFAFKLVSDNQPLVNSSVLAGVYQPITTRPEVGLHPVEDILVLFGTGKFHEVEDLTSSGQPTQSFYSIWDKYSAGTQPDIDQSDLLEQTIDDERTVSADLDNDGDDEPTTLRVTSNNAVNYRNVLNTGAGTHLGWYLDLIVAGASDNEGERIFGDPSLRNGQISFATVLPSDSQCTFDGSSVVYRLESASGGRPFVAPIDQTIDGIFANGIRNDAISAVPTVLLTQDGKEVTLSRSEDGTVSSVIATPGGFERQRATWRELR